MARRWIVLAALVLCVLLVLLLRRGAETSRAPPRRGLLEGESVADPPDVPSPPDPADLSGDALPERDPTFLAGHVYGPDGSAVREAEVRVVHPKTYELVFSDKDGGYRLPFERSGRFLVEAALTTELAPEREWADIPESGDPAPLDFHLGAARGAIFGELTLEGAPVDALLRLCGTDIAGDETPVHDLTSRCGCFNFYLDPPKDVPLRLDVQSYYGILPTPLRFTWTGTPMDLGTIELTPYPTVRIRMRLPDGTYAKGVWALPLECLQNLQSTSLVALQRGFGPPQDRLVISAKEDVTTRRVFMAAQPADTAGALAFLVEREVTLLYGRPQDLEVGVRPGPLVVAGRLVDREGRGLRGRVRCGENEAATGEDGAFRLTVPHGGLHIVHLVALDVPGIGPVELARDVPAQSLLLDADDPRDCVYDTGGRILLVSTAPCAFTVTYTTGRGRLAEKRQEAWSAGAVEGACACCLSPRLHPRGYAWTWDDTSGGVRSGEVRIDEGALAVVDAR